MERKRILLLISGLIIFLIGIVLSFNIFKHYLIILLTGWILFVTNLNKLLFKDKKHHLKGLKEAMVIILLGTITTILIELIVAKPSPAWIYSFNFFNFKFDFWFSIGAYIFFIPATFETYLFFKNLFRIKKAKTKLNTRFLNSILLLSLILIFLPLFWHNKTYGGISFCPFIIGLALLIEVLNNKILGESIIFNSLKSFKSFLALIITTVVMSLVTELTNLTQFVWKYVNLPFLNITILNVPIIILLGWIPLVSVWLNLYCLSEYIALKKLKSK